MTQPHSARLTAGVELELYFVSNQRQKEICFDSENIDEHEHNIRINRSSLPNNREITIGNQNALAGERKGKVAVIADNTP